MICFHFKKSQHFVIHVDKNINYLLHTQCFRYFSFFYFLLVAFFIFLFHFFSIFTFCFLIVEIVNKLLYHYFKYIHLPSASHLFSKQVPFTWKYIFLLLNYLFIAIHRMKVIKKCNNIWLIPMDLLRFWQTHQTQKIFTLYHWEWIEVIQLFLINPLNLITQFLSRLLRSLLLTYHLVSPYDVNVCFLSLSSSLYVCHSNFMPVDTVAFIKP